MAALEDLLGRRFDRLLVISRGPNNKNGGARWHCVCSCGGSNLVSTAQLKNGGIRSCGCLRDEAAARKRGVAISHGHKINGRETPEYHTWRSMIGRCTNPSYKNYARYGGRGIKVCERWLVFENFLEDMGTRPLTPRGYKRYYSIDRRDNNGDYCKENCTWASPGQQQSNRRSNHLVTYAGREQTLSAWALEVDISKVTLRWRLKKGWSVERALFGERHSRLPG